MPDYIPTLTGLVHPEVDSAIRYLYQNAAKAQATLDSLKASVHNIVSPTVQSNAAFLHTDDKKALQNTFQANGSHPLNVSNLLGVLVQPQVAKAIVSSGGSVPTPSGPVPPANGQLQINNDQIFFFNNGNFIPVAAQAIILYDTHANRVANFLPANYPKGTPFLETDRNVLYYNDGTEWAYGTGTMVDVFANRPTDLVTTDINFLFISTDTLHEYFWTGSAWTLLF